MQSLGGLTTTDLKASVQKVLRKFEVWDGAAWQDLTTYLKSLSFSLGGAGVSPDPIAGQWSAEIDNHLNIFHPRHPTSEYAGLLRIGRKVKISVGGTYGGTAHYWPRLIGWMEAPAFDVGAATVSLSGGDYLKRVADTILQRPTNFWGSSATFSTVETTKTYGNQYYTLHDALDVTVENNYVTTWSVLYASKASVSDAGAGSSYALEIVKDTTHDYGWAAVASIGQSLVQNSVYEASFWYKRTAGIGSLACYVYNHAGTSRVAITEGLESGSWVQVRFHFVAVDAGAAPLYFYIYDAVGNSSTFRVDQVSIKEVTTRKNTRYPLPDDCNGVYYATLDGAQLWYGDQQSGWFCDAANNVFYFDDDQWVETGSSNLVVHYFTDQSLINVTADLVGAGPEDGGGGAGLYATRAAALAAMVYTDPSVTLAKVWFEPGTTALEAVAKICERCGYRFWMDESGIPHFKPAPSAGSVIVGLGAAHVSVVSDFQDLSEIRNHVEIDGIERGAFSTADDKLTTRMAGLALDATSIADYLAQSYQSTNDLFQDQGSLDAATAAMIAAFKSPRWYTTAKVDFNPLPLQLGDTVTWDEPLDLATTVTVTGIVRDASFSDSTFTYKLEATS